MASKKIQIANVNVDGEPKSEAAFLKMRPKYEALLADQLLALNIDPVVASTKVLGRVPRIKELRAELASLQGFDPACVDDLEDCAFALEYAHNNASGAGRDEDDLQELNLESAGRRDVFIQDQRNLVTNGLIEASCLAKYDGGTGYKVVVEDVGLCLSVYRTHWSEIQGKTCCTLADLDRAEAVIHRMKRLIGSREAGALTPSAWVEWRLRAHTLLIKNYDQVRRAVSYVRWDEGDANEIAPSLFAGRGKGKSKDAEPDGPQPAVQPQEPSQPAVGPNGPFVPVTPNAGASPSNGGQPRLAGMPGGSPFGS